MTNKNNISPNFQNESQKPPFRVPEDYFDTLEERIESRVERETEQVPKKGKLIRMLKPVLAMAASFALVFLLVYYPLSVFLPHYLAKQTATTTVDQEDSVSQDDILFSLFPVSDESLYEALNNNDNTDQADTAINADDMLDYLSTAMNETEIYAELQK
ncbi:MAG TPA: hypothetical protein VKA27_09650 [Sunxiuqinia sp.]|nr:hypothetical protein [Sunxiuqinia sp.]